MFEYKVRCRHKLSWKEIKLYADTDIEEFFNRNSIEYVRNITDTIEHKQLKEIERLKKENELLKSNPNFVYAMRNNKAIEYIENEMPCLWEVDDIWEDIEGNYQHNYKEYDTQILLNKLKGVNKE